jgi:WD40 repeat protein
MSFPDTTCAAAWSPCGRFIAIARPSSSEIAILDAVTLDRLYTMHSTSRVDSLKSLVFSPDSRLLTCHWCTSYSANYIISWDLQTGGLISDVSIPRDFWSYHSMSYSGCGTMLGVLFRGASVPTIIIYNILSGARISSHLVNQSVTDTIWTHGACLRFATVELGSITVWEVGFTSRHTPTEVDSLPTPDNLPTTGFLLFPTPYRLAFILRKRVLVWDARHPKMLLDSADVKNPRNMSFSPDGHFFACGTEGAEFYLWKESPDGYLLHQNLISSVGYTKQIISPNGESIVAFGGPIVQRWHTTNPPTFLSSASTQPSQHTLEDFLLDFSPDRTSAVFTRQWDYTVTVLDLRSCVSSLIINTGMEVCGLGLQTASVAVVGRRRILIWDMQDHASACLKTNFRAPAKTLGHAGHRLYASVSPYHRHIVVKGVGCLEEDLCIYDMGNGKLLASVRAEGHMVGFSRRGVEGGVWCATADGDVGEWVFSGSALIPVRRNPAEQQGFPWQSSRGYQVTDDGWIINSRGKRLLWLPHRWQSGWMARRWDEHFLALLHGGLPEPVILDLKV